MTITNGQNFANASTAYSAIFSEVFQGDSASSNNYEKYCLVDSRKGTNYEFDFLNGFPLPREWKGKKVSKSTRANKVRIETKPYESTTSVSVVEFDQQPELVGAQLRSWLGGARNFINKLVVDALVENSTVYTDVDGVAFFSTAHPLDNGGTQSNTTTSALSQTTYRAAANAMMGFTDQAGRPLGIVPKKLIVGPALQYTARDIIEAKYRTQGMTSTGTVDSGTIVTAAAIDNVVSNDGVELIVEPLLVGTYANYWFLVGEAGDAKPMVCNIAQAPSPSDNTAEYLPNNARYDFSIVAQLSIGKGVWQTCYGGLVSA